MLGSSLGCMDYLIWRVLDMIEINMEFNILQSREVRHSEGSEVLSLSRVE